MIETVTENTFINEMSKEIHGFSIEGAKALFNMFEEYEIDCDQQIEFDPIAIRREYSEYENLGEASSYSYILDELTDEDEIINALRELTKVIEITGGKRLILRHEFNSQSKLKNWKNKN
jgi:NADH/NAD ratio-sensing transcriptional regulator Rex